ncbi:hypothetical protein Lal_00044908 [Lupinus albus]|nr:hypothetical protein Lal_00044908 [Lupinus albus]
MGDKSSARESMRKAGVPVVPGSQGLITDDNEAFKLAREMATAGGGGAACVLLADESQLENALMAARSEASAAFADGMSKIQVMADAHGNCIHLGERDCSVQRRHQKLIEESPSPALSLNCVKKMGEAAVRAAKQINYEGAGTVEFILAGDKFYFMEMNTRIQVEHPVTEAITGVDLIKEQIRVASGLPLSITQDDVTFTGHAIECRINGRRPRSLSLIYAVARSCRRLYPLSWRSWRARVDSHCYPGLCDTTVLRLARGASS